MAEDVLVIGAGPAGIASAYRLQQAGLTYRVIDRAEVIASTWDSLYPSLRLNTTRFYSHLPKARFPWHYGIFPTGRQYHRYLVDFAKKHRLNIQLGVAVECITPENGGWRVVTSEGQAWYPAVISATGRFTNPYTPSISGLDDFRGSVLHAHDYTDVTRFRGQRVMVVGNGPSGLDISIEIGRQNAPEHPALLAMRTGIILRPRYPYGLPKHLWMMLCDMLPEKWGKRLNSHIESLKFHDLDRIGIKTPKTGESSGAASTRGSELITAVKRGWVKCVDAPDHFDADGAALTNGDYCRLDAVILGTGYRPVLHRYFEYPGETDTYGWPLRDLTQHPNGREVKGYPGLYLVGVFYQGKGAMYNFNVEAEIAVQQIQQRLTKKL